MQHAQNGLDQGFHGNKLTITQQSVLEELAILKVVTCTYVHILHGLRCTSHYRYVMIVNMG